MGIPKFFRFISERWPLISQLMDGTQIPEFDNLYLDMNSILHTCTHSNDDDTLARMTEDQMFAAIFKYIEHLFEIIKPNQVFYMAIDGVAPRAKMNQQRARRFRTAYEAEENLKKAVEQGLEIPKEDPFDSNSITPGTEFMAKLTDNLKYFIHKKISEDSNWAKIKIVLSGHEVPGEGEHKIMDYIRTMKSQENYNPNLRHCIYGLDADLIMLGLVSHDPHFALLREEVTFGPRNAKKSNELTDQKFFLLHISLLREYIALEFQDLENELKFEYDFERVLDDFILIMYVIGNDFLPNLPDLFINKGAFPLLIETFKQSLRSSDGYLNERGTINLKRFGIWLNYLSEFELENFEKQDVDIEWFNKRLDDISITGEKKRERMGKLVILKSQKKLVGFVKPWLLENYSKKAEELIQQEMSGNLPTLKLPKEETEKHLDFVKQFALEVGILIIHSKSKDTYEAKIDVDGLYPHETDDDVINRLSNLRKALKKYESANLFETEELLKDSKDIYNEKFLSWKDNYYKDKLHFSIYEKENLIDLTEHYLEGLQWVLYYYYKGCPSWNWYFRYHYAPRISDIAVGLNELLNTNTELKFEKSKPFKPFEQLMAVLPARSRKLMPVVYRSLMTDPHSPIIDFYPDEVDIDLNGKSASWEAVVLLSFVDEKRLINTLRPIEDKLTPEETKRNSIGTDIEFIHNPQIDYVYPSPLPAFFHEIEHDKCFEQVFVLPPLKNVVIGLPKGAKLGKDSLAGFPTLKTIPFSSQLSREEIRVFQNPSKSESMILTINNIWDGMTPSQFSQQLVNKIVYSKWPNLRECKISKVMDDEYKYEVVKSGNSKKVITTPLDSDDAKLLRQTKISLYDSYARNKGVKLGEIPAVVFVQPVNGLIRNERGALVKTFSKHVEAYPIQLIVEKVTNSDERYATRKPIPVEEEFPIESQVIFLGDMGYGAPATVVGYNDNDKLSIRISKIQSTAEPNIGKERVAIEKKEIKYYPSFEVAKLMKFSPLFLSKITSGFILEDKGKKFNIGLELKFEGKREKVLGYTRKSGKFWEFSALAIKLINDYKTAFPKLFENLIKIQQKGDIPTVKSVSSEDEMKKVRSWLKDVKSQMIRVSLESESLTKFSYQAIENFMEDYVKSAPPVFNKDIKGVPKAAVLNPSESYQMLNDQSFELGDRVIYVQDFGKVPKLSKGTVVSITTLLTKTSLGVVFDEGFISGNNMNGKLRTNRGIILDSSLVLNLSKKQFVYHSKASKERKNQKTNDKRKKENVEARPKQVAAPRKVPNQAQAQAPDMAKNVEKEHIVKKPNELLNLLKGGGSNSKGPISDEAAKDGDAYVNNNAAKHILGQIYSNVMNEGVQRTYGFPPQPVPHPMFQQPPVQGNFIPMPHQTTQSQQYHTFNTEDAPNGDSSRGASTRGNRGNGRGGSRGGSRGNRNSNRGQRGGKSKSPQDN